MNRRKGFKLEALKFLCAWFNFKEQLKESMDTVAIFVIFRCFTNREIFSMDVSRAPHRLVISMMQP